MRAIIGSWLLLGFSALAIAANGSIDSTFGAGGYALTGLTDATYFNGDSLTLPPVVQSDGKILICGTQTTDNGSDFFVARVTAGGVLDDQFSFDGKVTIDFDGGLGDDYCTGIALQDDGKIVVSGVTSIDEPASQSFAIARLTSGGMLDTTSFNAASATPGKRVVSFSAGGMDQAYAMAIQPVDQKIVVAGSTMTATNGTNFAVLRLSTDGSPDSSFNLTGKKTVSFTPAAGSSNSDIARDVAIDAAGNIVLGGGSNKGVGADTDFAVARLLTGGTPDPDFNADGRVTLGFDLGGAGGSNADVAFAIHIQHDGSIVLVGSADTSTIISSNLDIAIARLQPDGSPDNSFGIGGKTLAAFDLGEQNEDLALAVTEQSNGKILVAGAAETPAGSVAFDAVTLRFNADGSADNEYGTVGRKLYDFGLSSPSVQLFNGLAFQGTQIIATGITAIGMDTTAFDNIAVRLENDLIFADRF
jgi:uncharacterized delta-60 repeat protein